MSSYDIFGMGLLLGVTGLAVEQGWTVVLIAQIVWCGFLFTKRWIDDNRKAGK